MPDFRPSPPRVVASPKFSERSTTAQPSTRLPPRAVRASVGPSGSWPPRPWPDGAPVQIHGMDKDPFFALEGGIDAAREFATVGSELAELLVYPGDRHLFGDGSLPSYDAEAAALALQGSLEFLDRLG